MTHIDALSIIELGAVVLGLAVLARVALGAGISPIPLYLLAGLAFGEGGVAPLVTTEGFIALGSEIGLILLLFMLGLEHSARELLGTVKRSGRIAVLDTGLNFAPGLIAGLWLGWGIVPALFLGGVTMVTSSGIAAKILQDLGWALGSAGPLVVAILLIEDLIMAAYLPLLAALVVEGATATGILTGAIALGAVGLLIVLALRVDVGISRALFSRSDEALVLTILGVAILIAGIAELIEVSAAVGALLVGIALSGPAAHGARQLLKPLRDVFAAMFFVFIGLQVDPSTLPAALPVALGLAAVGIVTKVTTGWLGATWRSLRPEERVRAAVTLIPRGEFSLAIAGIGVAAGLQPRLATITVAYVLVLGTIGPIAARVVEARARAATG